MINPYIGHDDQIEGIEAYRLSGGKGDGMRMLHLRNGKGLEFTISADRCADIVRLSFKGDNYGYFSPCGYVAPTYYDDVGNGFLKSFTAGFLTTCGLSGVGTPCEDEGEQIPLHGKIGNFPAESVSTMRDSDFLHIYARILEAEIFQKKLVLNRHILCSLSENKIIIRDTVINQGDTESPLMLLYHMNMGYPLLSEQAELKIPSVHVTPRNARAAEGLDGWNKITEPISGFEEQCYYHQFREKGFAAIYNPKIGKGLKISFDPHTLKYFTQWKMMGIRDYVLGLEPGNCLPDGRKAMRENGTLEFIAPGEEKQFQITLSMIEGMSEWMQVQ